MVRRLLTGSCAAALALTAGMVATSTGASAQPGVLAKAPPRSAQPRALAKAPSRVNYRQACANVVRGRAACMSLIRTDVAHHRQPATHPFAAPVGVGYGPSSLQSAYKLPSSTAGAGETVAIVDAFDDPNAASDLAAYRSAWGLPACGAGCFTKVNENGAASPLPPPAAGTGWDVEESLDVDMVSAICPLCHIILVEANSATFSDLGTSVNSAVRLGALFVSNSYGGGEFSTETSDDTAYYNHPGVAVTASAGDSGEGVEYPAASQYVTAVGGTSLTTASNARGWNETVWTGTGSGCSVYEPKPSWQHDSGCGHRTNNDVAAVADPNTGVAVYDTYTQGGWLEVGGTSAASPIIASTFALGGPPAAGTYPSSYIYAHTSDLFDVTSGSNGSCSPAYLCTGEPGYDGPTGWGTPDGTLAFMAWSNWMNEIGAPPPGIAAGSGPAVSSWAANRLDVFVRGADNAIWHAWWDGTKWNAWQSLGPAIVSNPAAVSWAANRIDLFGIGTDGNLYHKAWNGSTWGPWVNDVGHPPPGIASGSGPAVSSWAANRLDVFVRGADNAIWHAWWDGTKWNAWESLGPAIVSNPAAVSWGLNRIDLFGIGTDGNLYHKAWNGSAWGPWVNDVGHPPPGIASGSGPAVSSWMANRLDVFVRGADNSIWHAWWDGTSWKSWVSLGPAIVSNPAAVSWAANRIDLFGVGTDGNLYHKWWAGS